MKRILIFSLLIMQTHFIFGQWDCDNYTLNFEDTFCLELLTIDTLANPGNVWQTGKPQKTIFNSAYSLPNVIVTDTINPYPPNDTSVFIIRKAAGGGFEFSHTVILSGFYQVNSDSLNDYGLIEFSPDDGSTWIDLLNDTVYNSYYIWWSTKPVLTGNSNGWQPIYVWLADLGPVFNIQWGDTIQYRFTFISDSVSDTLDGLMYDDLHFEDWVEGIEELGFTNISSTAFPNPTSEILTIDFENPDYSPFELTIYDNSGKRISKQTDLTKDKAIINTNGLQSGVYYYLLTNQSDKKWTRGKFIIEKK